MKRNLVIDANVPERDIAYAAILGTMYIRNISIGVDNPYVIHGFSLSYGDKNVFVKRLKTK